MNVVITFIIYMPLVSYSAVISRGEFSDLLWPFKTALTVRREMKLQRPLLSVKERRLS